MDYLYKIFGWSRYIHEYNFSRASPKGKVTEKEDTYLYISGPASVWCWPFSRVHRHRRYVQVRTVTIFFPRLKSQTNFFYSAIWCILKDESLLFFVKSIHSRPLPFAISCAYMYIHVPLTGGLTDLFYYLLGCNFMPTTMANQKVGKLQR